MERDAFCVEDAGDPSGDILVLARDDTRRHLDHRHLAAKAAVDLGELEPDVTAADHDEVRRKELDVQQGAVREVFDLVEAWDVRHSCPSADVDEYPGSAQGLAGNRHRLPRGEPCVPLIDGDHATASQRPLDAAVGEAQHIVLAHLDLPHVHGDGTWDGHPVVLGAAGEMRGIGTRHQCLGRRAAGVDAGAAEAVALDDRHALAGGCQAMCERRAGLAGADDDGVELGHACLLRTKGRARFELPRGIDSEGHPLSPNSWDVSGSQSGFLLMSAKTIPWDNALRLTAMRKA